MGRTVMVLLALSSVGCGSRDDDGWRPHVIKEVQHGPFTVKIPAGWRDASELEDPALRNAVPADQRWLAEQTLKDRTALSSIRFQQQKGVGAKSCVEIEDQLKREKKQHLEVVALDASGHPGCKVTYDDHRIVVAMVGKDLYFVDCVSNDRKLDRGLDAACRDVFAQLKLDYTPAPRVGAQAAVDTFGKAMVDALAKARACPSRSDVKVVLAIVIAADGAASVAVRSADDEKVGECAAAAIRAAKFPPNIPGAFDETIEW